MFPDPPRSLELLPTGLTRRRESSYEVHGEYGRCEPATANRMRAASTPSIHTHAGHASEHRTMSGTMSSSHTIHVLSVQQSAGRLGLGLQPSPPTESPRTHSLTD